MSSIRPRGSKKSCVIKDLFAPFKLSNEVLCNVMQRLLTSINQGLGKETHAHSAVRCFMTYVHELPTGSESGKFLALDLGGANFRVLLITLEEGKKFKMESRIYVFPEEKLSGSAEDFFDYIAQCLKTFKEEVKVDGEKLPLGCCFGFPIDQKSLSSGILSRWTKKFDVKGVVGKDIGELMKTSLDKLKVSCDGDFISAPKLYERFLGQVDVDKMAILNDTTGCLLSSAYKEPNTRIGVIVGTGSNASYLEKKENIPRYDGGKPNMIINTEWGNFGSDGSLNDILTDIDRQLDSNSLRPGFEVFEKMISVMYICELVRLSVIKCAEMNYLFRGEISDRLKIKGGFAPDYIYKIESDEPDSRKTMAIFEALGVNQISPQDCVNIRYITHTICKRSAHLVSAAISTLINKISVTPITVAVDGGLYRFHPKYKEMLREKIKCMVNPEIQFELMLSEDGSGRGAALVCATM